MNIPVINLRPGIDSLHDELLAAIEGVVKSGQFIMGPNVNAFELEAAKYLGVKHAIGVNSGTDALVIALRALGISSGDEVITTPFTFFATAEAISQLGATPIFVDIDSSTFNINPSLLESALTPRTKAILPVHLYGQAAEMNSIMKFAHKHNLFVIEDTAQAFGGEFKGQKLGTFGNMGCFSFFPSKNLGAFGDGGLIVTNSDEIAAGARMLRAHGSKEKYHNEIIGYNSRLDEIQAAVLRVKLQHVDKFNEGLWLAAQWYKKELRDFPGIVLPYEAPDAFHVYHQYTIRVLNNKRDEMKRYLSEQGIGSMVYYPVPLHKLLVYSYLGYQLTEAELAAQEVLSLPIWPQITAEQIEEICHVIKYWK